LEVHMDTICSNISSSLWKKYAGLKFALLSREFGHHEYLHPTFSCIY
jgi:hypothetical protein